MDVGSSAQTGLLTLLGLVITGLFTWLGISKVKHQNAKDAMNSRLDDGLEKRYEAAMAQNSQLRAELDRVKGLLAEADKRLTVVQMIADGDPQRAIEFTQDSAFVDMSRPIRPRPAPPRPSASDPFQAADPYAAPKKPRKP